MRFVGFFIRNHKNPNKIQKNVNKKKFTTPSNLFFFAY